MAIPSLSGSSISSTYNRLVQTDGTTFADGTGSIITALNITSSTAVSSSYSNYAVTASHLDTYLPPFPFTGSAEISGSLNIIGPFTASSTLVTGNVTVLGTASINTLVVNQTKYSSGSNQLGDGLEDTQTLFGTVRIPAGSFTVTGSSVMSGSLSVTGGITGSGLNINNLTPIIFAGQGGLTDTVRFTSNSSINRISIYNNESTSNGSLISFGRSSFSIDGQVGSIGALVGGVENFGIGLLTDAGKPIVLFHGLIERFRVAPISGNILIGTTTDSGFKLDVNGTARITNGLTLTGSLQILGSLTSSQDIRVNQTEVGADINRNTKVGFRSFEAITTGRDNIAIGNLAGVSLTGGRWNVHIGSDSGINNQTGDGNITIGNNTCAFGNGGYANIAIGDESGRGGILNGDHNVALGAYVLYQLQQGNNNTGIGTYGFQDINTTSSFNTGIGYWVGKDFKSGSYNIFIGNESKALQSGSFNTIIGGNIPTNTITSGINRNVILADGSGSIRLFSPENGNVGIGTLNPNSKLHVIGEIKSSVSASNYAFQIENSNEPEFKYRIFNHGSTVSTTVITSGLFYNTTENATIKFIRGGGASDGTIAFTTNNGAERMRITSTGNILIGTTSENARFQVRGSGTTSATTSLRVENSSGTARLTVLDDGTTAFNTNHLCVSSSGNTGVGTNAPSNRLHVLNDSVINPTNINANNNDANNYVNQGIFKIESVNNALYAGVSSTVNDRRAWIQSGHEISAFANALGPICLNPLGGNILIGTVLDVNKNLVVNQPNASLEIRATNENQNAGLFFGNPFNNSTAAPPKAAIIAAGVNTFSRSNLHFCLDDTTTNTEASLSNSRMILTKEGNLAVGIGNTSPISRLQVRGSGTTTSTTTFLLQNSTPTTLASVLDNGQTLFTGPSTTLANGVAQFNISQSLIQTAVTNSVIDAVRIAPTLQTTAINQVQTALKVQPTFTGSFTGSQNIIADFGATSVGSQLTVTDITSGSIYMVNDVSGLPIIEATSDWSVRMYNFPQTVFEKTGSNVNIYGTLNATGSFILPLSQSTTPVVGSAYWSGSLLFVYDGTRYRSSSFA